MTDPTGGAPEPVWGPPQQPAAPPPEAFMPAGYRWAPPGTPTPPPGPHASPPPMAPGAPHVPFASYGGYQGGLPRTTRPVMQPESVGIIGLAVTGIGAFLVIMGFTVGSWFTSHIGPLHIGVNFNDVANGIKTDGLSQQPGRLWIAAAFYVFGGWLMFGLALLVGILANLDTGATYLARNLSLLVGLIAVAWACDAAFQPLTESTGSGFSPDINAGAGGYLAIGGFIVVMIGSYFSMSWRRIVEKQVR